MLIESITADGATINFDNAALALLAEVLTSPACGHPEIAGRKKYKYEALLAMAAAFQAAALACAHMPER